MPVIEPLPALSKKSTPVISSLIPRNKLCIQPCRSSLLARFISLSHAISILIVLFIFEIPSLHKGLLILIIILAGGYYYRLHIQKKSTNSIIEAQVNTENQWQIYCQYQAEPLTVRLLDNSLLKHYLMILNFKAESGNVYSLILPTDAINAQLARQIRLHIRLSDC